MTVLERVQRLRWQRRATLAALAPIDDDQLEVHVGPDRPTDLRAAILALAQEDDRRLSLIGAALAALDWRASDAQRIVPSLARTRGRLRAALVGLRGSQLDAHPAPDEWSVRQTVRHLINNEARFITDSAYAVERLRSAETLPLQPPGEPSGPGSLGPELPGGVDDVVDALEGVRDRLVEGARGLATEDLAAAMPWAGLTVDVEFMLRRRATHERQHTIQILKILKGIDLHQSEVQMLLGEAEIARGALEGLIMGLSDGVLEWAPGQDQPTVGELVVWAGQEEAERVAAMVEALWR